MNQSQNHAILEALAAMLGVTNGKSRKSRSDKGFTKAAVAAAQTTDERKAALDAATIVAFSKAGFGKVTPRVDVLTYGKPADGDKPATGWLSKGRKVKAGQKSVKVKAPGMHSGIPLFHVSQTEEIPVATATETTQS
jgi:hypothetical protein